MKVVVIEHGDYEQRGVWGVAGSIEAAVRSVKSKYGAPYIVQWEEPRLVNRPEEWLLMGLFSDVPGYSTQHTGEWTMTLYDVET